MTTKREIIEMMKELVREYVEEVNLNETSPLFYDWLANYELPEEKWEPKVGEDYWIVEVSYSGVFALVTRWSDDYIDNCRLKNNPVFKTKELAEAAAERVRLALKG